MLECGMHDVPAGKLATVVTHLEMRAPPVLTPRAAPDGWTLRAVPQPDLGWYRDIFKAVGQDWLWQSRRLMDDATLAAIIHDDEVKIWTLGNGTKDAALLELNFRNKGACELAFFGLTPDLIGTGAGRFLMNTAIGLAWARDISRFHLNTCTLDSPQAKGFYLRSGFTPTHQQIEIADDPRITLGFDPALAPHVPMFRP